MCCCRYYPEFLGTPLACRYQLEYIAGGELRLMDFLLGQNTLFYFMEVSGEGAGRSS